MRHMFDNIFNVLKKSNDWMNINQIIHQQIATALGV